MYVLGTSNDVEAEMTMPRSLSDVVCDGDQRDDISVSALSVPTSTRRQPLPLLGLFGESTIVNFPRNTPRSSPSYSPYKWVP